MNKICMIFNTPSIYRRTIYEKLDEQYDCEWFFGDNSGGVKSFDTSLLKHVHILKINKCINSLYTVKNLYSVIKDKQFSTYLLIGAMHDLSIWRILIANKIFYKKKIILWTHGWYGKETFLEKIIKKIFFSLANKILVYGKYAKSLMILNGIDSNKIAIIHNSLDYERQLFLRENIHASEIYKKYFKNNHPVIIMIGRLNTRKHMDLLIHAILKLNKQNIIYNVVIIGDGEERVKLEKLASDNNIKHQIWFYGACYDENINAELLYNADLCVVPGDIGLTAIHSMMFGIPVITHNCYKYHGPEFEIIKSGITGAFYEYENIDSLAETISNWFSVKQNCRKEVREACYSEIDKNWTPQYQINIIKQVL